MASSTSSAVDRNEAGGGVRVGVNKSLTLQLLILANPSINSTSVPVFDLLHLQLTSLAPIPACAFELVELDSLTCLGKIVYFHQTTFDDLASG